MTDNFDPYHKWLGIPPKDQPPHHYRLLAIELFEADADVIDNAAEQRMLHVKRFQSGRRVELSQKLLNEIAAARDCLLDPGKRAKYDATLRAAEQKAEPQPNVAETPAQMARPLAQPAPVARPAPPPFDPIAVRKGPPAAPRIGESPKDYRRRRARQSQLVLLGAVGGLLGIGVLAGLLVAFLPSGDDGETIAQVNNDPPPIVDPGSAPVEPLPDEPAPIVLLYEKIAAAIDADQFDRTPLAGGPGGNAYVDRPTAPRILVGLKATTGPFRRTRNVIKSVRPIYRTPGGLEEGMQVGNPVGDEHEIVATDGYAVGAIFAKSGANRIMGFKLLYMRITPDGLDPSDTYESVWTGNRFGGAELEYSGKGQPAVGIHGRSGLDVDSVGLLVIGE